MIMMNTEEIINDLVILHLYTLPHTDYAQLRRDLERYAKLKDKDIENILWRIRKGDW
jgi:hypothetical protein